MARPSHTAALRDRWRGAMLGTAVGDAVGAPFEGRPRVTEHAVRDWLDGDARLVWTDDTAMAIGLAQSLVATDGRVDHQHLGETFAANHEREPWRGYGAGPPTIFAAAADGTPFTEAAAAMFDGDGSFGNGAAMRVAPAAIAGAPDLDRVASLARDQAIVTHAHPLAIDGAVLVATSIAALATADHADAASSIADLDVHLTTDDVRRALRTAIDLADEPDPARVAATTGHGIAALEAVPAAVAAFLGAATVEDVLVRAVTMGGDTDTIAAMATAMAGASLGSTAIPARLRGRLEAADELAGLADRLAAPADTADRGADRPG